MLKKLAVIAACIVILMTIAISFFIHWVGEFTPSDSALRALAATEVKDIFYLRDRPIPTHGKILAIVTSTRELGDTGKITGYELSELARAYWVFSANGFEVDIASPEGDEPHAIIDDEDMNEYDYAFLNDITAQKKAKTTIKVSDVDPDNYSALYFVGGKGAMFDFPDNPAIKDLIHKFYTEGKVISAICHGPAALVNVKVQDEWLVSGRAISAFTKSEELLLMPDARSIFPFLLQEKLEERGAQFFSTNDYLNQVSVSGKLITAQNPWSTWSIAEEVVKKLGYEPKPRKLTREERSVSLLQEFYSGGLNAAENLIKGSPEKYNGHLVLMHAVVAAMKYDVENAVKLIVLAEGLRPK